MSRISFERLFCKSKRSQSILYQKKRSKQGNKLCTRTKAPFFFMALVLCWYFSLLSTWLPVDVDRLLDSLHHVGPPRGGIIVLGMHRSGTSLLTGLLVDGLGYHVGEPLLKPALDNEKGFYELSSIVKENSRFLNDQQRDWWYWFTSYNATLASNNFNKMIYTKGDLKFSSEGLKALHFLNDPLNIPWVVKDPRLCITLKTWLPLLTQQPAVVFLYRHPLEVATSLAKRDRFSLDYSLLMWIIYNMRAIQNSSGLCLVLTSNDKILTEPYSEVVRILQALEQRCHVVKTSKELTQGFVDSFVNVTLHHIKEKNVKGRIAEGQEILQLFRYKYTNKGIGNEDDCVAFDLKSNYSVGSSDWIRERRFYLLAMKIYCDFASGLVLATDYEWPKCVDYIDQNKTCCSLSGMDYCSRIPILK